MYFLLHFNYFAYIQDTLRYFVPILYVFPAIKREQFDRISSPFYGVLDLIQSHNLNPAFRLFPVDKSDTP